MWLSQKHFSLRSGFFKLHLQHHFITTQAARNKYVNMQWIILHFIWAQRPINWKVFFKKLEPWSNCTSSICSVATTKMQLMQGTEHQCSICSSTEWTCITKKIRQWEGLESLCQEQWERELCLPDSCFPLGTTFRGQPHTTSGFRGRCKCPWDQSLLFVLDA